MESTHYNDMIMNGTTFLLVPQSHSVLPIFGTVHFIGSLKCNYYVNGDPIELHTIETIRNEGIKQFRSYQSVNTIGLFVINFTCTTTFRHHIDDLYVTEKDTKTLRIFVKKGNAQCLHV